MGINYPIGWEDRLVEYVESKRNTKFRWGSNDCVLFALKGLEKIYCLELVKDLPKWTSKSSGIGVIGELGGDLVKCAENILPGWGFKKAPINFASRGDLVIAEGPEGPMYSICIGSKLVAPGKNGLEFIPVDGICWKYKGR